MIELTSKKIDKGEIVSLPCYAMTGLLKPCLEVDICLGYAKREIDANINFFKKWVLYSSIVNEHDLGDKLIQFKNEQELTLYPIIQTALKGNTLDILYGENYVQEEIEKEIETVLEKPYDKMLQVLKVNREDRNVRCHKEGKTYEEINLWLLKSCLLTGDNPIYYSYEEMSDYIEEQVERITQEIKAKITDYRQRLKGEIVSEYKPNQLYVQQGLIKNKLLMYLGGEIWLILEEGKKKDKKIEVTYLKIKDEIELYNELSNQKGRKFKKGKLKVKEI